jgi:hypothetical protein
VTVLRIEMRSTQRTEVPQTSAALAYGVVVAGVARGTDVLARLGVVCNGDFDGALGFGNEAV